MLKRINKIYCALFVIGLCAGLFFALNKARALTPEGESSQGESPSSVAYDESWKATQTLVSTSSGYQYFYPYGSSPAYPLPALPTSQQTPTAGQLENTNGGWVEGIFPKLVVTKWSVHGHIHFR
ncbi:MAG: hypothetical protein V1884_02490 [Candidatus Omnitrophota bacterium]